MNNEKNVTIYGRVSFPQWTAEEAYQSSLRGSYPAADVGSASPNFMLVVNDAQWAKFRDHAINVFLPYCAQQHAKGEKRDALSPKEVQALIEGLQGDLAEQVYNSPAKALSEKTQAMAPEGVAAIKAIGPKGGEITLKAIVNDESELRVPDPDVVLPAVFPLRATIHTIEPGYLVAATLGLYAYHNGKHPGFSAGVTTAVFKAVADRFGGGVDIDTDEIFLD